MEEPLEVLLGDLKLNLFCGYDIFFPFVILKLSDIRANGGKTNMMHFLGKLIEERYPELKTIGNEFPHLQEASRGKLEKEI